MSSELERLATLEADVRGLVRKVDDQEKEIRGLRSERKNLLIWGVLSLGTLVTVLGGYIWSFKIG